MRALAKDAAIGLDRSRAWFATPATQALFVRLDRGQADEGVFADALGEIYGRSVTAAEAKSLVLSVFEDPDLYLWALTTRLRTHCAVGGFSDNPDFVREVFPPGYGLDPLFLSCQLGLTKTSTEAFAAVQAQLDAPADEVLFVDDTAANIELARRHGWDGIHYVGAGSLMQDLIRRGLG